MNKPDTLVLVDLFDRQIGTAEKMEAHRSPRLHRAFSVFLYRLRDGGAELLLQKRASGKYHSGGLWANACCSHPRDRETLDEAVNRRLLEELGISCAVRECGSLVYYHRFSDVMFEYEYDHLFVGEFDGECDPDPEEIDSLRWVGAEELASDLMKQPESYAPWFRSAAPLVLSELSRETTAAGSMDSV